MNRNDPFHTVGSVFIGETNIEDVSPETPIVEALKLMRVHRFSQLPVVENDEVIGIFSFWSFAQYMIEASERKIQNTVVEDAMEEIPSVKVTDSLHETISLLEQNEALLVDSPQGLQAIMTESDLLHYFYGISKGFILIQEIELALRDVISVCTPGPLLAECIERSLNAKYKSGRPRPTALVDMEFNDYKQIICQKENWKLFDGVLGRNRDNVESKLTIVADIRNDVLHFRTDFDETTTLGQHLTLSSTRNWLLGKTAKLRQQSGRAREVRQNDD